MIEGDDIRPGGTDGVRLIERSRRLFNVGLFLTIAAKWSAVWLYLAAGVLLGLKVFFTQSSIETALPGETTVLFWLGVSFIPCLLAALVIAHRRRYSDLDAAAWLDLNGGGGGAVIAAAEAAASEHTMTDVAAVDVRPTLGILPVVRGVVVPLVFATVVLFVPWKERPVALAASVDNRAEAVAARVTEAKRLNLLPKAEARTFKQRLERAKAAGKKAPEAAAESIDTIDKQLDQAVLKSAKLSRKAIDDATRLLAEAGKTESEALPGAADAFEKTLDAIVKRRVYNRMIQQALRRLAKKYGKIEASSMKEMVDQLTPIENMDLDQLRDLARALQKGQIMLLDDAKMAEGLLSGSEARKHLALLTAGMKEGEGRGQGMNGGVNRGPGTVPLELGVAKDADKFRFKPMPVKKGDPKPLIPGALAGKRRISGGTEPPPEFQPPSRSGAVFDGTEGGSAASTLGPRNQAVVARYFTEEERDE